MIKVLVGNVRDCEQYRDIKGIKLLVTQIKDNKDLMIIGPIDYKEIEQFYKVSFETGLKDSISDDFDYCIWYLLDKDCELIPEICIDDLENIREATEKELKEHTDNLEKFKRVHDYYSIQDEFDKESIEENNAKIKFDKEEKVSIEVPCIDNKFATVKAITYKGFAIHEALSSGGDYLAITIMEGPNKGRKLCGCYFRDYKKIVDDIVEIAGTSCITESNKELVDKALKQNNNF